jgi:hypothetical protein
MLFEDNVLKLIRNSFERIEFETPLTPFFNSGLNEWFYFACKALL